MFKEHRKCWNDNLRNLCREVFSLDPVKADFFLTGSTALAVFWLGHRKTDNLDFFTTEDVDFHVLGKYLKNRYDRNVVAANDQFILVVKSGKKISFAKDHLSLKGKRRIVNLDGVRVKVDTLENLVFNKTSAFVSRFSRNDVLDVMYILKLAKDRKETAAKMILGARKMEALAEDTRYVLSLLDDLPEIYPDIAERFPKEIMTLREVVSSFDRAVDTLYR